MGATATKVRDLAVSSTGALQSLYRCDGGPLPTYVVVSAVTTWQCDGMGPETYIFAASEDGTVINWTELEGSQKGTLDHATALRDAGYEVRQ